MSLGFHKITLPIKAALAHKFPPIAVKLKGVTEYTKPSKGLYSRILVFPGPSIGCSLYISVKYETLNLKKSINSQAESISKNIIEKTNQTIKSKEKNSLDRIKQIELSAIQSIKSQASIELNTIIRNYFSNLSDENKTKILNNSVIDLKSVN